MNEQDTLTAEQRMAQLQIAWSKGGKRRSQNMSKAQLSAAGRKAANAKWAKWREAREGK